MSNYDDIQYRGSSEPRHRRMQRYDDVPVREENAAPAAEVPQAPASGSTTRAPRVYDGYRETENAARPTRATNDVLLEQRSRAFEKQAQHTGVYTRMTQTGYHQTIRQPQRSSYDAQRGDPVHEYADRQQAYDEYEAPAAGSFHRDTYERPTGRTTQRPAPREAASDPRTAARAQYADQRRPIPDNPPDEDEPERFPMFARIILIVVLVLILLIAGLYFLLPEGNSGIIGGLNNVKSGIEGTVTRLSGLIRPTEEPAQVKSITCVTPNGTVGDKCLFNVTTSQNVTGVALCDTDGSRITSTITKALTENDNLRIWELSVIFDKPYSGDVFASIQQGDNVWITSDKYVNVSYMMPQATPAPVIIVQTLDVDEPTPGPADTADPITDTSAPFVIPTAYVVSTPAPDTTGEPEDEPGQPVETPDEPTTGDPNETNDPEPQPVPDTEPEATAEPADTPAPTPTPVPTPTPLPTATHAPTPTPLPALTASSDASKLAMSDTVYIGSKVQKKYERETAYAAPDPNNYTVWDAGVLTFRGDNFRRNAAFGSVEVTQDRLSVLWKKELGHIRTSDSTVYGVGWTGQPAIVKWSKEIRQLMNLSQEKKNVSALREVIFSAQDGKVYFLDLNDGEETRAPINIGYPLKGSVSVNPRGYPIVAFGQGISKLKNSSGKIGYYLYNLIDQSELMFVNGRQTDNQIQYTTNGAFDGTDLTLWNGDRMIVAGENGLLYTIDLNIDFKTDGSLAVDPKTVYLKSKAQKAQDKRVGVESSVAMYNQYAFLADSYGALRCVDTTTMKTVWAYDTGDNTDAAIALDMEGSNLWLYTGNTNSYRLGKKNVSIRRLNAMTGEVDWTYEVACAQDNKNEMAGCKASPVIGEKSIDGLVYFTVNMLKDGGSKVVALEKATGNVHWEYTMSANAISSPVAVYNAAGDAWIIQADQDGTLHLLDAQSGADLYGLKLDGKIEASPAVYKDTLVIGTCSRDGAFMYGIKIE